MLTYRGDKFVRGKKFKVNESIYTFSKYDADNNLIFEAEDKEPLKMSKDEFENISKYDLIQADSDKLDDFYNGSSLTFEGCTTDKDNLDYLYNWLKEAGVLKDGTLPIYTYKGNLMNEKYNLTGDNKYPDDLNFITIMLEDLDNPMKIVLKRFELGGRWFDDIVENNKYRERKNMDESFSTKLESSYKVIKEEIKPRHNKNFIIEKKLKESTLIKEVKSDKSYIEEQSNKIYDDVMTLAKEAKNSGYYMASKQLQDILDILDELDLKQEENED